MAPLSSAMMNIAGSEWIIILLLAIILIFGTKKLPQFSRSIGKAIGEFEKAREMFRREMEEASDQATGVGKIPKVTGPVGSEREKLETLASSLGIEDIDGLTDSELRSLISKRIAT
ncbi:MAG TPA: twin-arginine translocase TatA/TatE family subunit [Nitrososphaera sp.]|nr:twin-arginine translocase TatA/TatE family subunit [Nitrososphaera sp.]HEX2013600.1 twin-arginine translocase TatA/TatE family subunit [Nitrososphaera sp.]